MYSYVIGKVTNIEYNSITIENNSIGYNIFVCNPYKYKIDSEVKIYLYFHVKEDEHVLFGFSTEDEKKLFMKLIEVKGLGPKMTLPILASATINDIESAIEKEDILFIKKFPKIGDKLARQIILDLKGNLNKLSSIDNDYIELKCTLKSLGYKSSDISNILSKVDNKLSLEDQVKQALKLLLK
ncbi:MAG TPA: Holliday junction branch migration protein RuvA [Bacilli bacterium]|nr:Holliday junction branch migration protein RuvA [Bacilli bacterium]